MDRQKCVLNFLFCAPNSFTLDVDYSSAFCNFPLSALFPSSDMAKDKNFVPVQRQKF